MCGLEDRASALGLLLAADHGRFPLIAWFGDRKAMAGLPGFSVDHPLLTAGGDARDFAIRSGDVTTLDGGLRFMTFTSDMKRSAYLLRPGEVHAPASLEEAWRETLRVADRYARRMVPGAHWDEVSADLAREARALGLTMIGVDGSGPAGGRQLSVHGHPIGNVVHDIGPRVAPGPHTSATETSRLPLRQGEWVSIEFHLVVPAADAPQGRWYDGTRRFEQAAQVGPSGAIWLVAPQEALLVVGHGQRRRGK